MLEKERRDHTGCIRLVEQIEQQITLSPAVRNAFLHIPRLLFVPAYYQQQGQRLLWTLTDATAQEVYTDQALVTQVDAQGMPSSSSSQPSIMAAMLEALQVRPRQRVLEIGTGTGYNAALLAHLVGKASLVTTIDLDEELVERAGTRLVQLGYGHMHLRTGDGLAGVPRHAPYDRLVATGGVCSLPSAWIQQLAPGGKLVANLLCPLSHGIVVLTKRDDRSAHGSFLALSNSAFIQLRSRGVLQAARRGGHSGRFPRYLRQPLQAEMEVLPEQVDASALHSPSFLFYLQLAQPTLTLKSIQAPGRSLDTPDTQETSSSYLVDEQTLASMTLPGKHHPPSRPWTMRARGPYNLWERVYDAYQDWESLHRPALHAYQMEVNQQGQQIITLERQQWE
jgi:protein-L-isoaspartate(D-aspartate) O-methyltransferase